MFGSLFSTVGASAGSLESKLFLYVVAGVAALVIINLLLDGIRKYIRGLDTAALGGLFIWLGYKSAQLSLVNVLSHLLYLIGATLLIMGLIIFIIMMMIRRKRSSERGGPPMPKHAQTAEKARDGGDAEAQNDGKPKAE